MPQTLIFKFLYLYNPMSKIFQTMTSVISNNPNLKNQRCTSSGCRNIGIRKLGFMAKTQFLCHEENFKKQTLSDQNWEGRARCANLCRTAGEDANTLIWLNWKRIESWIKLWFNNPYIFSTQCCRPYIFQFTNSVRSNNLSLKYVKKPYGFIPLNTNIGIYNAAWPHSWNRVSYTGFHYDTLS